MYVKYVSFSLFGQISTESQKGDAAFVHTSYKFIRKALQDGELFRIHLCLL